MIQFTSNSAANTRPESIGGTGAKPASASTSSTSGQDTLSAANSAALQAALAANPEIRPEVVEEGRKLMVDLNYPPRTIINDLAELIANSTDLSNLE